MRSKVLQFFFHIAFLAIVLCLLQLQIFNGKKYRHQSLKNSVRLISQPGARGIFLDRKGRVLVDNILTYDVLVSPEILKKNEKHLLQICQKLGIPFERTKERIMKSRLGSLMPVKVASNVEVRKIFALEELKWDIGEIIIQPHPIRRYPHGNLAAHVLGYLGQIDHWRLTKLADYGYKVKDIVGYTGLEEKYDYYLRQEEGGTSLEVDHRGRPLRILGFKPAKNGMDIQLTIDLEVQKVVEENLKTRLGCVIIMQAETGQIIALANYPNFNPGDFLQRETSDLVYLKSQDSPLLNRAISGLYPAASVFKVVVAASGLELAKIDNSTSFFCDGGLNIGNRRFGCWATHGQQDLFEAIAHSCDVYFYHLGLLLGAQNIHAFASKFGLGKVTGVDLPYEECGQVPNPTWKKITQLKKWFDGDTANFSIGQGELLVTPLQLTRMMAVFANKGFLVTPYLTQRIGDKEVFRLKQKRISLPFKKETFEWIRRGLRQAVALPSGTAHILSELPVDISGKTGTAQVPKGQSHAWFVGYFSCNNNNYVICVFLEHGGASQAACTLTYNILQELFKKNLL